MFGCAGPVLSERERAFFAASRPAGFILFARNCDTPQQIRTLVGDLREAVNDPASPVLIDQEGGRVARLKPPQWRNAPPMALFGKLAMKSPGDAVEAARLNARMLAAELQALGITVNCAPVLDLTHPGAHDIIGDRALHTDPHAVGLLGRAVCEGLLEGGVLPVIKHIPGHGRALADSHHELPTVGARHSELSESDFIPFRMLSDMPMAMTAHVTFGRIDPDNPATTSATVIEDVIRDEIGFNGLLLSDDLSMKALEGSLEDRATASIQAGCDVVLHCNGNLAEMEQIAGAVGEMSDVALERYERAEAMRDMMPAELDMARAGVRLNDLLATVGTPEAWLEAAAGPAVGEA